MGRPRRLLIALACVLATFSVAAPVVAGGNQGYKETGVTAEVSRDTCTSTSDGGSSCDSEYVYVFVGKSKDLGDVFYGGTYSQKVFYIRSHYTLDSAGNFLGGSAVLGAVFDKGTITADGVRSVNLAPTTIAIHTSTCDAVSCTTGGSAGTIVVEGRWSGVGPTTTHKNKSKIRDDSCVEINRDKGESRAALFTGTAGGNAIEQTFAQIMDGTILFKWKCKP
jgi:hypothetical protein